MELPALGFCAPDVTIWGFFSRSTSMFTPYFSTVCCSNAILRLVRCRWNYGQTQECRSTGRRRTRVPSFQGVPQEQ